MSICFKVRLVAYAFTLLLSLSALSHAAPLPLSPSLEAILRLSHWRRPLFHNSSSDAHATVLILADVRDGVEQERLLTIPPPQSDGSISPDRLLLEKRRPWFEFMEGGMGDIYMPKKLRSKMLKSISDGISQVLPPITARGHAEQSTLEGEQTFKRSTTLGTSGTSLTSRNEKCEPGKKCSHSRSESLLSNLKKRFNPWIGDWDNNSSSGCRRRREILSPVLASKVPVKGGRLCHPDH